LLLIAIAPRNKPSMKHNQKKIGCKPTLRSLLACRIPAIGKFATSGSETADAGELEDPSDGRKVIWSKRLHWDRN